MKKSNIQNRKHETHTKQTKEFKHKSKLSNAERARLADMNQIEWLPVDPYFD